MARVQKKQTKKNKKKQVIATNYHDLAFSERDVSQGRFIHLAAEIPERRNKR